MWYSDDLEKIKYFLGKEVTISSSLEQVHIRHGVVHLTILCVDPNIKPITGILREVKEDQVDYETITLKTSAGSVTIIPDFSIDWSVFDWEVPATNILTCNPRQIIDMDIDMAEIDGSVLRVLDGNNVLHTVKFNNTIQGDVSSLHGRYAVSGSCRWEDGAFYHVMSFGDMNIIVMGDDPPTWTYEIS